MFVKGVYTRSRVGLWISFFLLFLYGSISVQAQSLIVDGSTSTSTSTDASGKVTVDIAPANSAGTSLNRYSNFNVDLPGVDLDNRSAGARTIVNEVTSSNPTSISGPLQVLGNQADVIVANPNGITINGGSFVNTGNVGLVTGNIQLDSQGRATSQVRGGTISIGSKGLSGAIQELDLISKTMRIEGNIRGMAANDIQNLNLFAGESDVVFDPNRPFPAILPWASVTGAGGENLNALGVDITRPASVAAGSIRIVVTDRGAGVRIAGNGSATDRSFRLTASGKLETIGAEITANDAVDLRSGQAEFLSDDRQTRLTSIQSGVVIETTDGDLDLDDSSVEGQIVSSTNLASEGGVTLISSSDIRISDIGSNFDASLSSVQNGATIRAQGDVLIEGLDAQIGDDVVDIASDDLTISSAGDLLVLQSDIIGNGGFQALAAGNAEIRSSRINVNDSVVTTAARVSVGTDDRAEGGTRSEIISNSGGLLFETTQGDFTNEGGLLQGEDSVNGDPRADGAVTVISAQDIINRSLDLDHLGVLFSDNDALSLQAQGSVYNDNGRLFSNTDLRINAAHDFTNETRLVGSLRNLVFSSRVNGRLAETLWLKRGREVSVVGDFGTQAIENELGLVLAIGDVSIDANNISNVGGDISGTDLLLSAQNQFFNRVVLEGSVFFSQKCRVFCRSSGRSDVRSIGGTITAANDLSIMAASSIETQAGRLIGNNNATFVAPSIIASQLALPVFVERPSGLSGFFRGERAWLGNNFEGAQIAAFGGDLTFDGNARLEGASLLAQGDQAFTGSLDIVSGPSDPVQFGHQDIGFLWELF